MKLKWTNSIKTKILIVYIATATIILIAFSAFLSGMMEQEAIKQSTLVCLNTLQNIRTAIDSKLQSVEDYRYIINSDNIMMDALLHIRPLDLRTNYQQYLYQTNIRKGLVNYKNTSSFLDSFSLYSYKGETYFSYDSIYSMINNLNEQNCKMVQAYEKNKDVQWRILHNTDEGDVVLSFQPIYDFYTNEKLGLLSINVNATTISQEFVTRNAFEDMNIYILDSLGTPLSSPENPEKLSVTALVEAVQNSSSEGKIILIDSREYLAISVQSDYTDWTLLAMMPLASVLSSTTYINSFIFITYIVVFLAFLAAAVVGVIYFYKPLKRIFVAMGQVEAGDLSVKIQTERHDEVGYIISLFNQMVSNLNKQIQENYVNQLLLREAQLINLYSQIDEHFLYNTLDSIKWAINFHDKETLSNTIVSLSKYYRISLSAGKDIISIREVVEQLEAYLQIQKFRLHEKLSYELEIDDSALDLPIIKYILQPLVENCVVHGIGKKAAQGLIKIHIERRIDTVYFEISDTGAGIPRSKLEKIKKSIENPDPKNRTYFALHTVNMLLKTFYNDKYRLNIESYESLGTSYNFEIPIENDAGGEIQNVQNDNCG